MTAFGKLTVVLLLLSVMAVLAAWPAGAEERPEEAPLGELLDGIVAVIGDQVVTRSELAQAISFPASLLKAQESAGMAREEVEREFARLQLETRDHLVDNQLILTEARADGIDVREEVSRRMARLKAGLAKEDPKQVETFLAAQGYSSLEDYERQMVEELMRQRLIFGRVRPRAELTAKEFDKLFQQRFRGERAVAAGCNGAVVSYFTVEQVWYPLEAEARYSEVLDSYGAAYRCYAGIKEGRIAIEKVSEECDTDEVTPQFGKLGELEETNSFDEAFQKAFDDLVNSPGATLSPPFVIKDGVRFLRVSGKRQGCITEASDLGRLKDRVRARLEDEQFQKALRYWLQELRGKYRVELRKL